MISEQRIIELAEQSTMLITNEGSKNSKGELTPLIYADIESLQLFANALHAEWIVEWMNNLGQPVGITNGKFSGNVNGKQWFECEAVGMTPNIGTKLYALPNEEVK